MSSIDVLATTISGSIRDWSKVERIEPLFRAQGIEDVCVHVLDSHRAARAKARELVATGSRTLISAGGSGTFNALLEGCYESGAPLAEIRLGFLRKGSADLIGKTLHMPDDVEEAVTVFVEAVRENRTVPCDILEATSEGGDTLPRHFVGYGGAEIFGDIPRYTENRFIKWYKGVLSQLFGDLGPFFVGTSLAFAGRMGRRLRGRRRHWSLNVDGAEVADGHFQAIIIVNGYLGPDLPFAADGPLGSGDFHVFALRDQGALKAIGQIKHAWNGSITENPSKWGFERFRVTDEFVLRVADGGVFPLNVDGSAMRCRGSARVRIVDGIRLLAGRAR